MKVISTSVNSATFIEIQYHTLKKYMRNEYEFIIFNNAKKYEHYTNDGDLNLFNEINDICNKLCIKCIIVEDENKSYHHCNTATMNNIITKYMVDNPDEYLIIDSDMFLINYFDINKYKTCKCAIVIQERHNNRIKYMWNGIYYFNIHKMEKMELIVWDAIQGTDDGGSTYKWLEKVCNYNNIPRCTELRNNVNNDKTYILEDIYFMKHLWSCSWNIEEMPEFINDKLKEYIINDPRNTDDGKFFCEIYDNSFLHYRAGSNWMRKGINKEQIEKLKEILVE